MKNIVLLCNMGMSTSLIVTRMQKEAAANGWEYNIAAYPVMEASEKASDADVILVGPQVRHALPQIKSELPNVPSDCIDMRAYGMMDAKTILAQARKIMGDE